ncbi:AAA family ATPase [Anatilimnocola floriformis]|uniref:AAA family ATPase n=1 Tax=Anatilimnocola floriformis TaxID=2948575 RepID=UPI0020C48888|nr:AAA family ATPase [Anatilimnocola floriformis]
MPKFTWRLAALVQTLADETLLAESLLFPGVSLLQTDLGRLRKTLGKRLRAQIKKLPPEEAWRCRLGELPEVKEIAIEVPPIRGDRYRTNPVTLKLHYVQWQHGPLTGVPAADAVIAFFPALQIEILAPNEKELAAQLEPQIRSALSRQATASHLQRLVLLDHRRSLQLRPLSLQVKLPTLKQAAVEKEKAAAKEISILKQVAFDLTQTWTKREREKTYERTSEVQRLAETLAGPLPRSVLLVGKSGVGKTAVVRELARLRGSLGLADRQLWSTSGSRIVAGMTGFGMWQERCQKLLKEAARTRAVVHLDHLAELIEVGKGGGNQQGIASLLCPAIARGTLLAIAECTPQQIAAIEREDPQLLEAFVQIEIAESTPEQTRSILQQVAGSGLESAAQVIEPAALGVLDRLHRRYAAYSAAPGRPLRFLRNMLEDRDEKHTITASEVTKEFSQETGLPLFMLDDAVPLDVEATRRWFQQRVIGQPQPVDLVVDLIAAVKAGLARGGKPIASVLFIGPTGVGKTEMAKSLAEFLYQDPHRMIRFDMSEYAHAHAIERLIGGTFTTQGLLTQKVRDQPFMVVLLDEFEKAHPLFFDVLLQVLGEGRLTDGAGRVADFTSTVVIMTSNLGAESFRQANVGFGGERALEQHAERHFEQEVKNYLRPEMFNRLDRIVPFAPLDQRTINSIAQREIERVTARDGIRLRNLNLTIEPGVVDQLAANGFDPRYGARPLKRAIERQLVAPLAEQLTRYAGDVIIDSTVKTGDGQLTIESAARPALSKGAFGGTADNNTLAIVNDVVDLRRKLQQLRQSGSLLQARNEIHRLRQVQKQERKKARKRGHEPKFQFSPQDAKALRQEKLLQRVDSLTADVFALEEMALQDLYAARPLSAVTTSDTQQGLAKDLRELLFDLYLQQDDRPSTLTLVITGEDISHVCELGQIYANLIELRGPRPELHWLRLHSAQFTGERRSKIWPAMQLPHIVDTLTEKGVVEKRPVLLDVWEPTLAGIADPPDECIGLALETKHAHSISLLQSEGGAHLFEMSANRRLVCNVEAIPMPLIGFEPPPNIGRVGSYANLRCRRRYAKYDKVVIDPYLNQTFPIVDKQLEPAVAAAAEAHLANRIWALLDQWN